MPEPDISFLLSNNTVSPIDPLHDCLENLPPKIKQPRFNCDDVMSMGHLTLYTHVSTIKICTISISEEKTKRKTWRVCCHP